MVDSLAYASMITRFITTKIRPFQTFDGKKPAFSLQFFSLEVMVPGISSFPLPFDFYACIQIKKNLSEWHDHHCGCCSSQAISHKYIFEINSFK